MKRLFAVLALAFTFIAATSLQSAATDHFNFWHKSHLKVPGWWHVPAPPVEPEPEPAPAPATGGSVKVYDANDQYLGILLNNGSSVEVFIPGLNMDTLIDTGTGQIGSGYLTYENEGCTGEPMISIYSAANRLWRIAINDEEIYMAGTGTQVQKGAKSVWYGSSNSCQNSSWETMFYSESVSIPKEDIPFTLPVALPLKFKYQ